MIQAYFRPVSVDEAVKLLSEPSKERKALGGGTNLSRQQAGDFDVVDLQGVGLDQIEESNQGLQTGAMVRLDNLLAHPQIHSEIKSALCIDASENIRNMATLGGWLVSSDGRSILTTVLLALDATLTWEPGSQQVRLGNWLPLRGKTKPGVLMTRIAWQTGTLLSYEYVARSPKDRPLMIVAAAKWGSGRTRVTLGGFGEAPILAMDGPSSEGAAIASRDACSEAEDQWASAQYRREIAARLALRCVERLDSSNGREA